MKSRGRNTIGTAGHVVNYKKVLNNFLMQQDATHYILMYSNNQSDKGKPITLEYQKHYHSTN